MARSVNAAVIEAHLRRLDADTCTALVEAVWDAQGFETSHQGSVILAIRGNESVVIYPLVDSPLGFSPSPSRPVDVVVAPGAGHQAISIATRHDARLLDASDLRQLLIYGINQSTAARLCERYLGAPMEELRPPLGMRVRQRLGASLLSNLGRSSVAVVSIAVIITVAAALGTGGVGNGIDRVADRPRASLPDSPPIAISAGSPTTRASTAPTSATGFPPGVTADGIANLTALSLAHQQPLGTYTTWVELYYPRGGQPDAPRVKRDITVTVAGNQSVVDAAREDQQSNNRTELFELYNDGSERYLADQTVTPTHYRRLAATELSTDISESGIGFGQYHRETAWEQPILVPEPQVLRRELVVRYLSTAETDLIGRVPREGDQLYKVVGSGQPAAAENVRNYTFEALITADGLVRRLTAEYTVETAGGSYSARFRVIYGRAGGTFLRAPAWYDREFGDNGTTSSQPALGSRLGPGDPPITDRYSALSHSPRPLTGVATGRVSPWRGR